MSTSDQKIDNLIANLETIGEHKHKLRRAWLTAIPWFVLPWLVGWSAGLDSVSAARAAVLPYACMVVCFSFLMIGSGMLTIYAASVAKEMRKE